jgi:AraC-like DNA-binding protein
LSDNDFIIRNIIGESLNNIGFAVGHFPSYTHTEKKNTHGHDILEANYILSGTAIHQIDGEERSCPPGSMGIIQPGQNHSLVTGEEGAHVINMYLDTARYSLPAVPDELSAIVGCLFPPAGLPDIPRGSISFLHFQDPAPLASILLYCVEEQKNKQTGYEASMESALRMILIACARQAMADGVDTIASHNSKWQRFEKLRLSLEQNYAIPHTLGSMADELDISEGHLCRQYKAYTGMSPMEYLIQRRVRAAMQELRTSKRKVLEIAFAVGFSDLGYFNRKFRQIVGSAPRDYRSALSDL